VEKMKVVWNLSRDPICREVGENLFIFQMFCLGDWKKVVHQAPWTFRGWGVLIEDYDGLSDLEKFVFDDDVYVWAQIHGIPELYRKKEVVDDLARRVGKVKEVQMTPKLFYDGNYVRIRVRIDISRPLMRFVSLTMPEGKRRLAVKYEKIPFFCKRCGLLGHDHEECGDGVWTEQQLQYGSWMLAVRRASQPTLAPRRFTPRAPVRGGFAGRVESHSAGPKKRSSGDADLDTVEDLKDSATSPIKSGTLNTHVIEGSQNDHGARKQLEMIPSEDSGENSMEANPTEGEVPTPPLPPQYVKTKDMKKAKKAHNQDSEFENLASSAASLEDDRRA
jgi:sporulation protein YlmC with PRC-barrel domain